VIGPVIGAAQLNYDNWNAISGGVSDLWTNLVVNSPPSDNPVDFGTLATELF
jgi:hypothetical protein